MSLTNAQQSLEDQFAQWRGYMCRRESMDAAGVAKLEVRLREQVAALVDAGLAPDEAFLVAVKRLGDADPASRDFAREQAPRLWNQLVGYPSASPTPRTWTGKEFIIAIGLAVAAAATIKLPELFGVMLGQHEEFYIRNLSFFVLPFVTAYFAWKRRVSTGTIVGAGLAFLAAAFVVNIYPATSAQHILELTALHLPIALWLVVGITHAGGKWGDPGGRMDFVRFTGELFIYYVLIALGGGVLCGFTALTFNSIGIDIEQFFGSWLLPCGATGAVIIASWLVEARQGVMESLAPMLTRIFTPLFAAMLLAFLGTMLFSGRGINIGRELLIAFDLLLVVVLGLLLYSISARNPNTPPGAFDAMQIVLVVSALIANAIALWAIAARINEFGFTPNRVAALGENIILLVNLTWSAVLYLRFMTGRGSFTRLEKWQTDYIPIYSIWAALVVLVFPLVFD